MHRPTVHSYLRKSRVRFFDVLLRTNLGMLRVASTDRSTARSTFFTDGKARVGFLAFILKTDLGMPHVASTDRPQYVLTDGNDEEHLSRGVYDTYTNTSLRLVVSAGIIQ